MSKRVTSRDLVKKVSATSANDLVVKVKYAASQLAVSVKTAQADFNERAKDVKAELQTFVSAVNVVFDIDNFAVELISSGVVIDDVTINLLKNLVETPILSDIIAQKDVTKLLGDIVTLNESLAFAYSKALEEITSTSDNADVYLNKIREDTAAAADSLSLLINKAFADISSISQDDTVQYIKILGSVINTAPAIGYFVSGQIEYYVQVGPGQFSPVVTGSTSISGVSFTTDTTVNSSNSFLAFNQTRATGVSSSVAGYISGGYITAFGGGISGILANVNKIDISTSTLSTASFLHTTNFAKFSATGVESDTRGYYLGGHNGSTALNEIDGVQFSNDTYINPAASIPLGCSAAGFSSLAKGYAVKGTTSNPLGYISNVQSISGIRFADETGFLIGAAGGLELESASSETTTRGYVFGGHYNQSRVSHLRFADETYNIDGVSLLSARESSAGLSSANSGYVGGGNRSDMQKFNYANSTVNTIAASLGTNTIGPTSIQPKLNRQTTAVISDSIGKGVGKQATGDTARGTDATTKRPNKGLSDTVRSTETLSFFTSKNISQDISRIAESIEKYFSKQATGDTARGTDVTTKQPNKGLSDTASFSEVITRIIEKHLTDNVTTFEGVTGFDGISFVLDNTETNTSSAFDVFSRVVDYVRSGAAYNLTHTSTVSDTITSKDVGKGLSDTAEGDDAISKEPGKALSDTAEGDDALSKEPGKALSDTVQATETFTRLLIFGRSFADTSSVADELTRSVEYSRSGATYNLVDITRGTDAISKEPNKRLGNVYSSIEQDKLLSEYLNIPDDIQEKQTLTAVYTPTDQNISRATDARTKQIGVGLTTARGGSRYTGTFLGGEFVLNIGFINSTTHLLEGTANPTSAAWLAIKTFEAGQVGVIIDTVAPGIGRQYPFTVVSWQDEPTRELLIISSNIPQGAELDNFAMDIIVRPTSFQTATRASEAITKKAVTKGLSDIARGTDEFARVITYNRSGATYNLVHTARGTDTDTIQYTKVAGGESTAGLTDFVGLDYNQELIFPKLKYDRARVSDSVTTGPGKGLSDTAAASDSFFRLVAFSKNYADTARATDELSRVVNYSRLGATYNLTRTARATDVATKQIDKALFDTARGTDAFTRVVNYIRSGATYNLVDITRGTDAQTKTASIYGGGEEAYVEIDVAGIGPDLSAEISQNYNNRNFKPVPFVNLITTGTGANGPATAPASSVVYTSSPFIPNSFIGGINNGYISITILTTGVYTFDITGAAGGVSTVRPPTNAAAPTINGFKRAPGARIVGTISLVAGNIITMVIGQGGGDDINGWDNPGGGGGTFVTLGTVANIQAGTDTLLFAAGGGGGGADPGFGTDNYSAGIGQAGTAGGSTPDNSGGTGGSGAGINGASNSTGGGGYLSNAGGTISQGFGAAPADGLSRGFRQGAVGSRNSGTAVGIGGFGGGGSGSSQTSSDLDKGGGGGYSGGGFAFDSTIFAGGGGSFAIGVATAVSITAGGGTSYNGSVLISGNFIPSYFIRSDRFRLQDQITTKEPGKGLSDVARGTDTIAKDISIQASGQARTKLTEFTPINYTQDLLHIIQADL